MQSIEKHYKITSWCEYEEVALIGNVEGMIKDPAQPSYFSKAGHLCNTQTWFNDQGEGWEIRSFQVSQ